MKPDNYQRFVWYNDCILCTYVPNCLECPLKHIDRHPCMHRNSAFSRADNQKLDMKDRLAACDVIIKAIRLLEEKK